MKFTISWLKDHLDTTADLPTIANTLTMIGLEVEEIVDPMETIGAFTIAEITSAEKHPDADKLQVCSVNTGTETLQIVCGAPNARAGLKVVLAPIGTYIPSGDFSIKKGNIRGVESCGMMCSFEELGLDGDSEGIIEVPADAPIGTSYALYAELNDPMIEIAITPNRGDCLGVRGIARDLASAGLGTLKICPLTNDVQGQGISPVSWAIETPNAPAVSGRMFNNVKNVQSPDWMKKRLSAIGITPKTALVDITNYIAFELGRPLHVFDGDKIGKTLTIRNAIKGEKMLGLDDIEYALDDSMMVISDENGVQSIAGIMGGMHSAVTAETTNVFVESAWFDPINVAQTGRKLSIQSDARYRFERTVNPLSNIFGIKGATKLISEICGGTVSEITEAGSPRYEELKVSLRLSSLEKMSGIIVPEATVVEILNSLGFAPVLNGGVVDCIVPSYRPDVEGEHCLIEEVLRVYGFDKIPAVALPRLTAVSTNVLTPMQKRIGIARRALAGCGMNEAVTYAFMARKHAEAFSVDGVSDKVILLNPISADLDTMRPSILPNLLNAYNRNKSRGISDVALFEVGGTFFGNTDADQINRISGIRAGRTHERHWADSPRSVDVFDAKADAFSALEAMGIPTANLQVKTDAPKWYHPGQSGALYLGKFAVASFGVIHPSAMKTLGIKGSAVGFEINLNALPPVKNKGKSKPLYTPSQFQSVRRDFAFEVDQSTSADVMVRAVRGADKKLITDVRVFDVFAGEGVTEGKKSVAIMATLQAKDKTLTDADIEAVSANIVSAVIKVTGGETR